MLAYPQLWEKPQKYKIKSLQLVYFENTKQQGVLFPVFENNTVPIAIISSDFYVPYLSVLLESIILHSSDEYNYDIVVLTSGVSDLSQRKIATMIADRDNFSVRFYDASSRVKNLSFYVASSVYAVETYYRVLTPWILENYDKAIVMECDIVANCDISEFMNVKFDDKECIAAVRDIVYEGWLNNPKGDLCEYTINELKMKNPYDYVNTGVMVMNLKRIRENYKENELIEFCADHKFRIQEQDAINSFFYGQINFIDLKWNYYVETNPWITECINIASLAEKDRYCDVKLYEEGHEPSLIHWANQPKPWMNPYIKLSEEFWKYARPSPFYEIILQRMMGASANAIHSLSFAHRMADKAFPKGSTRREMLKRVIPRGSWQFELLKKMYHKYLWWLD